MTWQNRIAHLETEHRSLDKKIDTLEKTERFDDKQLSEMKKQRLHLRDEIVKLQAQHQSELK